MARRPRPTFPDLLQVERARRLLAAGAAVTVGSDRDPDRVVIQGRERADVMWTSRAVLDAARQGALDGTTGL